MLLAQFQTIGRDLFTRGLVSGTSGNLSIRMGDRLIITRRGSGLNNLEEYDLIETGLFKNDRATPLASSELAVHRAIYKATNAQAIVHAHPPHSVALSLLKTEIVPSDSEGMANIPQTPVVGRGMDVSPGSCGDVISEALKKTPIVVVYSHGSFATGQLLDDAYKITTTLEDSSRIICLLHSFQVDVPKE